MRPDARTEKKYKPTKKMGIEKNKRIKREKMKVEKIN